MDDENILHDRALDRIERLTGERWAPYPSPLFMQAVLVLPDAEALEFIRERRTYFFPQFLRGDPQEDRLWQALHLAAFEQCNVGLPAVDNGYKDD